jgi:hypothetical protein
MFYFFAGGLSMYAGTGPSPLKSAATGPVAPGKMGGHRKPVLAPHRAFIMERLGLTPHLTLHAPE